ncbi:putative nuclear hormone receptor HR3 [Pseudolycoriella hygida]|uniref:Nuclear hormone receptor HR3 n=1 Tax=Pseudolycoriella hygida TaxID=35572 RepID=A0A9Q0S3Q4_9DIPT|nr:putative nuclear hormone receptor HR3 [Pseudolycoriella hygida]
MPRPLLIWFQTKLEAHTPPLQTNVQANNAQAQSSGSIKENYKNISDHQYHQYLISTKVMGEESNSSSEEEFKKTITSASEDEYWKSAPDTEDLCITKNLKKLKVKLSTSTIEPLAVTKTPKRKTVKFGRMSKKQREKVEDEVRFHRAQMRAQNDAAPDSSVFDTQTPSSSDQLHHGYNNGYYSNEVGYSSPYGYSQSVTTPQTMGYDISADYVDSTTTYEPRSTIIDSDFIGGHIPVIHIHDGDVSRILYYKNLGQEDLWLDCAEKLTAMIQNIIEFAKLIPGFMRLSQDDQILLLKTGSFELAIVRMSRLMDLAQNAVLYGDVLLPQEAFYTSDCFEMKLVACIFETAKSIAELKLTETELALYQSLVLLWPERNGVRGNTEIQRLFNMSMSAIRQEIEANHAPLKGDNL